MWELGAGCPASGLLGVGAGRAHAPNKAPGPYAWGGVVNDEDLGISRCMGEKSRALFALCHRAPYTLVP